MIDSGPRPFPMDSKLVDDLYVEAMVLSDEARAYLESIAGLQRERMTPIERLNFSCESLKVTTRLMHVIAWLLSRRALARGEIDEEEARSEKFRLGAAAPSEFGLVRSFPEEMRLIISASESLYARAQRLEEQLNDGGRTGAYPGRSPARDLMALLETSF